MKTHQLLFILIFFSALIISCAQSKEEITQGGISGDMETPVSESNIDFTSKSEMNETNTEPTVPIDLIDISKIGKKLIKTAAVSCQVKNYNDSRKAIDTKLKLFNAYIASETENKYNTSLTNTLVIRVPNAMFDTCLVTLLNGMENIDSKSVNVQDVTEEFIDVATRLNNKRAVKQQYLEILKKAFTVSDILDVQDHLRVITEEIEVQEGRLKYLENQASYSTINLTIYQKLNQDYGFWSKIIDAVHGGWTGLLTFLIGLIYLWPLLLVIIVVVVILRRVMKRKKHKQN